MIKTHIAAIGMHAGEYVPCRAKYVPCRIAGKNEHIHFADEESIQEFNELNGGKNPIIRRISMQ